MATEVPGGYSLTLTSRLGLILREIETLYGPHNKEYTILGIEFEENGPQIWYPGNNKNIIIQLSTGAQFDLPMAIYQLSHEAVHLLTPSGGAHSLVLEEGLATLFAWRYVKKVTGVDFRKRSSKKYYEAGVLVEKLLKSNPDFIIKARALTTELSNIDADIVRHLSPGTNLADIQRLTEKF